MKFNRIFKEMKSDLVEIRVSAHRCEKLIGRGGLVRCSMGQQERLLLNSWCFFRSYDNAILARRMTRCDANSSPFWKIEALSKIEFEC